MQFSVKFITLYPSFKDYICRFMEYFHNTVNTRILVSIVNSIVVSSFSNFLNEKVSFCLKGASQDMYLNNS